MASEIINLGWEWPAGRALTYKIIVIVDSVEAESKGLFGIETSPSLGEYLPDSHIIKGKVIFGDSQFLNKSIHLRAPGPEVKEIRKGQSIGMGLVGRNTCICLIKMPEEIQSADIDEWLHNMKCKDNP